MNPVPTPHNEAAKEDIAKAVLMPGDPKRAAWIAETFLDAPRLVNDVRGIQGYTGTYKGVPVTVMASGMGISSIGIYAYELYNFYDVDLIIRVGTAGTISPDVAVGDVIIADSAYTDSNLLTMMGYPEGCAVKPDPETLEKLCSNAEGYTYHTGPALSELLFYVETSMVEYWQSKGVLAYEMEAACLFAYAQKAGKKAGAIFTASDSVLTGQEMDSAARERTLKDMVIIALESCL